MTCAVWHGSQRRLWGSSVADQGARSDKGDPPGACAGADRGAVPQMRRDIVEVIPLVPVESVRGRVADQMVDIPVLPVIIEEIAAVVLELVRLLPQERVQQTERRACASASNSGRIGRCGIGPTGTSATNGPSSMCQCLKFWKNWLRWYWSRLNEYNIRTVEQVPVPAPQVLEETVEVVLVPTEGVQQDDVLEALQLQVLVMSHEIHRTRSDVELDEKEFTTKTQELAK